MLDRHIALIVEDEPEMAAELGDLLRSFGHDHLHAETLADARARLNEGGFCYVLLDLQIKADGQSIKPRVDSGMAVLREIRKRFPQRSTNDMHLMPVLVISGHGKEAKNISVSFRLPDSPYTAPMAGSSISRANSPVVWWILTTWRASWRYAATS